MVRHPGPGEVVSDRVRMKHPWAVAVIIIVTILGLLAVIGGFNETSKPDTSSAWAYIGLGAGLNCAVVAVGLHLLREIAINTFSAKEQS
jgi:hypothetical protein